MPRLLFEKTGNAVWISHLDLMRLFQRAFKRAGLPLTHTHGFNPRPSVSIALPLSVGVDSCCELLDFDLDGEKVCNEKIKDELNCCLVEGVRVLDVYEQGRKIRDLSLMRCVISLEYDEGVPAQAQCQIEELFRRSELLVPKKTKRGIQDQDIISMIREMRVQTVDVNTVEIEALICCQNPTLNPAQISLAIENYLPHCKANHARYRRLEIYDLQNTVFR